MCLFCWEFWELTSNHIDFSCQQWNMNQIYGDHVRSIRSINISIFAAVSVLVFLSVIPSQALLAFSVLSLRRISKYHKWMLCKGLVMEWQTERQVQRLCRCGMKAMQKVNFLKLLRSLKLSHWQDFTCFYDGASALIIQYFPLIISVHVIIICWWLLNCHSDTVLNHSQLSTLTGENIQKNISQWQELVAVSSVWLIVLIVTKSQIFPSPFTLHLQVLQVRGSCRQKVRNYVFVFIHKSEFIGTNFSHSTFYRGQ